MPNKYEKYFKILDLDIGASKEDVKKAFRELSHIWHPDNHMGKSSNVQNRASEKFKEISNAYQVLKDYLSEEDSSREAEEKTKAEQDRRDREEKERKQQKENERRKKEEESRRKAEQDRRDREEKEHKYWEEQAKKKHEEEKSSQKNTEQLFVNCPECKEEIKASSTVKLRVICKSCGHIYHYFFENGKLRVVSDSNENDTGKKEKVSSQDNDFRSGRVFWLWAIFFPTLFVTLILISWILDWTGDSREEVPLSVAEMVEIPVSVAEMVEIPGGEYLAGADQSIGFAECQKYYSSCELSWFSDESPEHLVLIDGFFMDKYEVTQAEYERVMGTNPSHIKGENLPVEQVTWYEAKGYCQKVGKRLPTEAEWEKAMRAGTITQYYWGDEFDEAYAWTDRTNKGRGYNSIEEMRLNTPQESLPVGQKTPNPYGLYDMAGNVDEWTADWYDENYYRNMTRTNPKGPSSGTQKVVRGGSWISLPSNARSANRHGADPAKDSYVTGFRCSHSSGDSRSGKASRQQSEVKTERKHNQNYENPSYPSDRNFQSDSFSWTRNYVGNIYGKNSLTMQLQRNGDELTGAYMDIHGFYLLQPPDLPSHYPPVLHGMKEKRLRGHVRENLGIESFSLGEFLDSKRTGTFDGTFTSHGGRIIEGEWISEVDPTDKTEFKLQIMDTIIDTDPKYKVSGGIYSGDTSIKESLKSNGSRQCGDHILYLKQEDDGNVFHREYIRIMDDKGAFYETIRGDIIDIVDCVDLTGDGKPELFLHMWDGGMGGSYNYYTYVYLLDDPIRRLLHDVDPFYGK